MGIACAALAVGLFVLWRASAVEALKRLAMVPLYVGPPLAILVLAAAAADRVRARRVRSRFKRRHVENAAHPPLVPSADDRLARAIRDISLSGAGPIPNRATSQIGSALPDAIILRPALIKPLPNALAPIVPATCNVPFEPLPLSGDPARAHALLEEFLGLPAPLTPPAWARLLPANSPGLHGMFSLPRNVASAVILMLLWYVAMRDISVHYFLWPAIFLVASSCVYHVGVWAVAWYRNNIAPACWLFPGVIAIQDRSRNRTPSRDVIIRCGTGTLWYDVTAARLYLPLTESAYHTIHCPLADGLIAIWAWLNTAPAPNSIDLTHIA